MTRLADEAADVKAAILSARQVPCICPRQHDTKGPRGGLRPGVRARSIGFSESRGITIERVRCTGCSRTWSRVNA